MRARLASTSRRAANTSGLRSVASATSFDRLKGGGSVAPPARDWATAQFGERRKAWAIRKTTVGRMLGLHHGWRLGRAQKASPRDALSPGSSLEACRIPVRRGE